MPHEIRISEDMNSAVTESGAELVFNPGPDACSKCVLGGNGEEWQCPCLPCDACVRKDGRDGNWIKKA